MLTYQIGRSDDPSRLTAILFWEMSNEAGKPESIFPKYFFRGIKKTKKSHNCQQKQLLTSSADFS